jgi:hypothetical protein
MALFLYAQAHMVIRYEWDMKGLGIGIKAGMQASAPFSKCGRRSLSSQ